MRARHTKTRCGASGKLKWRTSLDAALAKANLGNHGSTYRCPFCGFWHLTRRPEPEPPAASSSDA